MGHRFHPGNRPPIHRCWPLIPTALAILQNFLFDSICAKISVNTCLQIQDKIILFRILVVQSLQWTFIGMPLLPSVEYRDATMLAQQFYPSQHMSIRSERKSQLHTAFIYLLFFHPFFPFCRSDLWLAASTPWKVPPTNLLAFVAVTGKKSTPFIFLHFATSAPFLWQR